MEILQVLKPDRGPLAAGIPAHIPEQLDAGLVRGHSPRLDLIVQLGNAGERSGRRSDQLGRCYGGRVAMRHQGTVVLDAERDRDRRMPPRNAARQAQVHVFLPGQDFPVVVPVAVVPEGGCQPGAEAQPRRGNGLVRDAAGATAHAFAPDFRARLRGMRQACEDDVLEDSACQDQVEPAVGRFPEGRERVEAAVRDRVHVRHTTPCRRPAVGARPAPA